MLRYPRHTEGMRALTLRLVPANPIMQVSSATYPEDLAGSQPRKELRRGASVGPLRGGASFRINSDVVSLNSPSGNSHRTVMDTPAGSSGRSTSTGKPPHLGMPQAEFNLPQIGQIPLAYRLQYLVESSALVVCSIKPAEPSLVRFDAVHTHAGVDVTGRTPTLCDC